MNAPTRYLVASAVAVGAAFSAASARAQEDLSALQPQTYNNVVVVNGGASLDEAAAIKRMAPNYPLRVMLSGRGGAYYVADQLSVIRDGNVVAQIPQAGPWILMDLPRGRYTLQADFGATQLKREVNVTSGSTMVNWVVPPSIN